MERYRAEIEALQQRIDTDLPPYREQIEDIVARINDKAESFQVDLPERPVAEVAGDDDDDDSAARSA
jgi:hypothetical protein